MFKKTPARICRGALIEIPLTIKPYPEPSGSLENPCHDYKSRGSPSILTGQYSRFTTGNGSLNVFQRPSFRTGFPPITYKMFNCGDRGMDRTRTCMHQINLAAIQFSYHPFLILMKVRCRNTGLSGWT